MVYVERKIMKLASFVMAFLCFGLTALADQKAAGLKPDDLIGVKVGADVKVLTKLGLKPFGKSDRYPFGAGSQNGAYVKDGKIVSIQYEPFIGMTEDDLVRLNSRSWINGHAVDPSQCDWKVKDETASQKVYVKEGVNGTTRTKRYLTVTDGKVSRVAH